MGPVFVGTGLSILLIAVVSRPLVADWLEERSEHHWAALEKERNAGRSGDHDHALWRRYDWWLNIFTLGRAIRAERKREIEKRILRFLHDNDNKWCTGYQISKQTGIRSGRVYMTLRDLMSDTWVEDSWETEGPEHKRRRLYRIRPAFDHLWHSPRCGHTSQEVS